MLKAATYDGKRLACNSMVMGLLDSEERSSEVASGEKYRTECDNTYICPIIRSIKTKQQANSKLSTQSAKGLNY